MFLTVKIKEKSLCASCRGKGKVPILKYVHSCLFSLTRPALKGNCFTTASSTGCFVLVWFGLVFGDRVSLCNIHGCSGPPFGGQADLHRDLPTPVSQLLGLKVYATIAWQSAAFIPKPKWPEGREIPLSSL